MLWTPSTDYEWALSSQAGVQPAAAFGDTVTPAQNAKGAFQEIFSETEIVNDIYGVIININSNNVSTAARDTILDIGTDPSGGTAYSVVIPDLLCSSAAPIGTGASGFWYYFPLFIPKNTAIAARASVNNATVGTLRVWMIVFGLPRHPDAVRAGSYVDAFGIVSASSRGTIITPGTTAEGAFVSLGTPTRDYWWWQVGIGVNDATMTANIIYFLDLAYGNATDKQFVVADVPFTTPSNAEILTSIMPTFFGCMQTVKANEELFGRGQSSVTPDANVSMAAYGLGG